MYAIAWTTQSTVYKGRGGFIFETRKAAQGVCGGLSARSEYRYYEVLEE